MNKCPNCNDNVEETVKTCEEVETTPISVEPQAEEENAELKAKTAKTILLYSVLSVALAFVGFFIFSLAIFDFWFIFNIAGAVFLVNALKLLKLYKKDYGAPTGKASLGKLFSVISLIIYGITALVFIYYIALAIIFIISFSN